MDAFSCAALSLDEPMETEPTTDDAPIKPPPLRPKPQKRNISVRKRRKIFNLNYYNAATPDMDYRTELPDAMPTAAVC